MTAQHSEQSALATIILPKDQTPLVRMISIPSLPPEASLGLFLSELGATNIVVGDTSGIFNNDWGHAVPDRVDHMLVMNSRIEKPTLISRTVLDYYLVAVNPAPGAPINPELYGGLEEMRFTAKDGKAYTFYSAVMRDGQTFLTTRISSPGCPDIQGEFSLIRLSIMMGLATEGQQEEEVVC